MRPILSLCAALALVAATLTAQPAEARTTAGFYTPPDPLPAGRPGDVIRAEPMTANLLPGVALPARAWRILYRSTTATGKPTAVSGVVLVPTAPWKGPGKRPIIGHAVGTQGIADRCATSHLLDYGLDYEGSFFALELARGWAVAVTDYPGQGTPGDHTYVVGHALGPAVLDSVRAARRLPEAGLPTNGPLAITGYSEGGTAAEWALQLQPSYAPDLPLVGGAAGDGTTDLMHTANSLDNGPLGFLQLYAAIGLNAAYPDLHLDSYLNAKGRDLTAQMRDSCIYKAGIIGVPQWLRRSTVLTQDVLRLPQWQKRIAQNRTGAIAPKAPVLLAHARYDEVIPYSETVDLYHRWCARGANARFQELPLEHGVGGITGFPLFVDWLASRFAGEPLPRPADCRAG
ncbi:triacylglycerol lipase [Actinomadura barringtoniae]|uniref:Triacylglycerol lipase n=1 Tax=Actinomadura barringtoniae TaxID=1427535 RepID=A0A939PE88_9ACTN|nr:lipase family protein [Actinomadura barringtoniae]MBO2448503.1 triacylglycerol lipase [Actinomadura barringtoniae]